MKDKKTAESHPFKDFFPKNIKYLIVGSFPGPRRIWKTPWFYGSKYSQFWKIMECLYGSYRDMSSLAKKRKLFTELEVGLTDIIKVCQRIDHNASDSNLVPILFNDIPKMLYSHPTIKTVFFTSSFVQKLYNQNFKDKIKNVNFIILPSPSPRFARMSLKSKILAYEKHFPKK
ncbi:MAG: DNA-deoxyinosine glycosylase [Elusimicrobia bacterium]|nr:DNA-deoxyinosine glycosylase [Elusimicrobiota bacterium]